MGDLNSIISQMASAADGIKSAESIPAFSSGKTSVDEIVKDLERKDDVEKLKKMSSQDHEASEWVKLKSKIEPLAGCERDIRARYKNRFSAYISGIDTPELTKLYAQYHKTQLSAV